MQKLRINDKRGAGGLILTIVAVVAVIALISIAYILISQRVKPEEELPVGECPESTGILTVNAVNALNKASTLSPTLTAGINGAAVTTTVTSGTTTFPVGASITVLANLTDYIDKSVEFEMICGGKIIEIPMFYSTSDNPGIRIKSDEDLFMTDTGGANNQTTVDAGESITLEVEFKGTSLESSGAGIWIVESPVSTGSNISQITLGGQVCGAVPSIHSSTVAGAKMCAFNIPAIEKADTKTYPLIIELTASGHVSGVFLTDWYAKQEFIDDDGSIGTGIQDSDGTAKYENTLDYDFAFTPTP